MAVDIVARKPTAAEYEAVVASVGFRSHDDAAVEVALANTPYCVCAVDGHEVVGLGRIIGDGAISFLLTNVMVRPSHQPPWHWLAHCTGSVRRRGGLTVPQRCR